MAAAPQARLHYPTVLGTPNPVTVYDPNNYAPSFMPDMTIYITAAGGIQDWVTSVPQCLNFESVDDLVKSLQALGYAYTGAFDNYPFESNGTFGGGPKDGLVPWIGISPVPTWHASDGAFVVNAGKYADFWNHGVHPFIGSSYHLALIEDIKMRMDAARGGQPNLGMVSATIGQVHALKQAQAHHSMAA